MSTASRTAFLTFQHIIFTALTLISLPLVASGQFALKDEYRGRDFYDRWNWETFDDPTHGRVDYISRETSQSRNLSYGTSNAFT
jgi:hypothetical protein